MKISKLFHWLYAILMLLPAFAIGVTCAYAIFNKNAYQSTSNYQDINNVKINSTSDFIQNTEYLMTYKQDITATEQMTSSYLNLTSMSLTATDLNISQPLYDEIVKWRLTSAPNSSITFYNSSNVLRATYLWNSETKPFKFIGNINNNYLVVANIYEQVLVSGKLDNIFYYSIDKVQQSPLFNWAYDSFLATPITYITGLFGLASDHIAVMLMSYWLAISIIWLVFDLVMYMPLLVHRWIDKGVLE